LKLKKAFEFQMTNYLIHECGCCANWKADVHLSDNNINDLSHIHGLGLCIGGIFSGSKTQFNETCSMWRMNIDKERIGPIFFENKFKD